MTDTGIAINGLTHRFGKRAAVEDLNLKVRPPDRSACFLGRNGAGKTTTIRILMNLLSPTAGKVEVLGLRPGGGLAGAAAAGGLRRRRHPVHRTGG